MQTQQIETLADAVNHFLSVVDESQQENQDGEALETLMSYLRRYGKEFVVAMNECLHREDVRESSIAATLTLLGRAEHAKTQSSRLHVLTESLSSPQVRVRDGAVAGLGYMMNKDAIPALEQAVKSEANRHVRRDMEHLITLLMEM